MTSLFIFASRRVYNINERKNATIRIKEPQLPSILKYLY